MARKDTSQIGVFQWFFQSEASGSILLLAASIAALFLANSSWADAYYAFTHAKVGVSWGDATFKLSLHHWVNDAFMVVFFFVVGLEIKREIVVGELSTIREAVLPVSAAIGGMAVPAAFYVFLNFGGPGADGWGIPMATDIAFALGILALFGKRVPTGLKVFLTALAIADDLGAVLVIAFFYTESINWTSLIVAGGFLVAIQVLVRLGIRRIGLYVTLCLGVWFAVFASGIHATVAGILVAFLFPVRGSINAKEFLDVAGQKLDQLKRSGLTQESMVRDKDQYHALEDIYLATEEMRPTGLALEHYFHPVQAYMILPLFAFFNAGVSLGSGAGAGAMSAVSLGIIFGLFVGKQVGVAGASYLAVKCGLAKLPQGVSWLQIYGAAILSGIGFTMSLFITELAFDEAALIDQAKIGILAASLLAGILGIVILSISLPKKP